MTDYNDLIERLRTESSNPDMDNEAAGAINELVAERDDYKGRWDAVSDRCNSALFDLKYARKLTESLTRRAEKVEADLAAARAALANIRGSIHACNRGQIPNKKRVEWRDMCDVAIAAARAEGGE